MNFQTKQILSAFLTISLVWVFVGCLLFCGDAAGCAEDVSSEISAENYSNIEDNHPEDSCPVNESVRTTAPDRVSVDLNGSAHAAKNPNIFSPVPVLPDVRKNYREFYRPPKNLPRPSRLRVLRI